MIWQQSVKEVEVKETVSRGIHPGREYNGSSEAMRS